MPRIRKESVLAYRAVDQLLWNQIRILSSRGLRHDLRTYGCYLALSDALAAAVKRFDVSDEDLPYVKHYVLCLVQIEISLNHPSAMKANEALTRGAHAQFQQEHGDELTLDQFLTVSAYTRAFETSMAKAMIKKLAEGLGLDTGVIGRIADDLLADPKLGIDSFAPEELVDLAFRVYAVEAPFAPLALLAFAADQGWVDSGAIRRRADMSPSTSKALIRLGLYREFCELANFMWDFELRQRMKENPYDYSTMQLTLNGEPVPMKGSRQSLTLDTDMFRSKAGQRVIQSLFSDSGKPQRSASLARFPGRPVDKASRLEALEYACGEYRNRVFVHRGGEQAGKNYRFGKMLSVTCAFYLHHFLQLASGPHELPLFRGGDEQKPSLANRVARNLRRLYGISITAKTLYQTYHDNRQTLYPALGRQWDQFVLIHSPMFRTWYQAQCYCVDIEHRMEQLMTAEEERRPICRAGVA